MQSSEWSSDINVVSGALKLWFRELPEPLLTFGLYDAFIEAARMFIFGNTTPLLMSQDTTMTD